MRKVVFFGLLVVAFLGSVVAAHALSVQVNTQPELIQDGPSLATSANFPRRPPLPDCGDPCYDPGAQRTCVDRSGGSAQKAGCECASGPYWGYSWHCN